MKRWILITVFLSVTYLPLFAQTSGKLESISLSEKDLLIAGEGRKGPYFLPDSLIVKDSEKVYINGRLLSGDDYQFNYIDGEIRFKMLVPKGAKIRIVYKRLPFTLKKQYQHHKLIRRVFGAPVESPADLGPRRPRTREEDFAAQLNKSGSITRGITVGSNRGLKVNSSLNINISGKVADNVEVVAALTDQTTPIQPEGTTQNLQEIDKVYVQIKAPNLSATMGDYNLDFSESQFARYSRKLQGAMGRASYKNFDVVVSGAVSRGKYYSMQFMGQEGNQGPYQLKGDRGQIDIIVLAGTERVYIDGELMVRGETNDYIIDYAAAQITFTRRRLITSDSRIVVDFQYSDEKFRRNIYAAQSHAKLWGDKLQLATTFLRESDDKDNPLDFTLNDEKLNILRQAGDDPQKSVVDGAQYVGEGNGRYIKDEYNIFHYVGKDSGDYQVSFSDVGENQGSYRYKGAGIYEYVGENLGRYAPVILLPTAKSHNLLDFGMKLSPFSAFSLNGELALSSLDLNTYSSFDDDDNNGFAHNWQINVTPERIRFLGINLGKLDIKARVRTIQDRFKDIDRTTEIEYNRRWDLPTSAKRGENVRELQTTYQPFNGFSIGGELGSIRKGDYFRSRRWQVSSSLSRPKLPVYDYRIEKILRNSTNENQKADWLRQRGDIAYQIWKLKPTFSYEGEIKKENWSDSLYTGFKFDDFRAGLETRLGSKIVATTQFSQRKDKDYIGIDRFVDKSTATTQNYGLKLQQLGSLSASVEFTHREREYADPAISNKRTDLAEIRASFAPLKRAISARWNYQISNTATAKKERVYIKVSEGDGNYRFDEQLNEYVNDPLGDYIMRILTTDEFVPVVALKTSSRIRIDPRRYWGRLKRTGSKPGLLRRILSTVSSESYVALEERTQDKDVWQIYLMNTSRFRKPDMTIFGNMQFRQDLFLFEHNRNFSVRFRYRTRDEMNNQFLEGGQSRTENEKSVRLTTRLTNRWSSRSEFIKKRTARMFSYAGRQNRDIYSTQAKIDLSYRPKSQLELALGSRFSLDEDRYFTDPTRAKSVALAPRVNYSIRSRGRLRGELEWSYVDVTPKGRLIPYEMADGRSPGRSLRWDIRFDYRVSQTIQATFSYTGRSEPERNRTIHTGRAQVTAAFR